MITSLKPRPTASARWPQLPQLVGNTYYRLRGDALSLDALDHDERAVLSGLIKSYQKQPGWNEFENEWVFAVSSLYDDRGVPRAASCETPLYKVAQDLCSRLGILHGHTRLSDYRDDLKVLIVTRFKSRREFCKATGLSEDMLSHVLARRKHLSIESLTEVLARIGYTLQIRPTGDVAAEEHRQSVKRGRNGNG